MQERGPAPALSPPGRDRGRVRRFLLTLVVAAAVVVADQLTKTWAVHRLARGPIHVVWKLDLELGFNSGASFSLAQGWGTLLAALAVAFVVVLLVIARRTRTTLMAVAIGLIIGGALGNLVDRVTRGRHGAVVDFIALHFWPTFNVADASIVVGGALAAVALWRSAPPRAPEPRAPAPPGSPEPPQ
ncbi:MAG TPA: signal peptidase II [Acidimicrobiales bacterium]|nr:signal peptidase II [Acidimicrobiales bacterium]